ncbi:hypothetical protein ACSBR1_023968 [Camellia fascicularis]
MRMMNSKYLTQRHAQCALRVMSKKLKKCTDQIDLSCFLGNLRRDDRDNGRDCWRISDGNNFRVRGNNFYHDKSKISAGTHLMELVVVDWFKDTK